MIAEKENAPVWQLQTAKAQFSKVVRNALAGEPQLVTKGGAPAVYVISAETYEAEASKSSDRKRILLASPHGDIDLNLTRSETDGREVEL